MTDLYAGDVCAWCGSERVHVKTAWGEPFCYYCYWEEGATMGRAQIFYTEEFYEEEEDG